MKDLKRTLLNLAMMLFLILSITSCRKDLYVGDDNLSGLSSEVTQAAKWYNSQLLTISKDSSFTAKNHPEWNQATVNNQKSNSTFNVPVYKEGAISRELKINRFGDATFSGTIKEYDRTSKSMTKVITYSINGKFIEEGVLYPTGQYRLLRSAGKEQSAKTLSSMGSEGGGGFPDEPTFPDPGNPTNPTNPVDPGIPNSDIETYNINLYLLTMLPIEPPIAIHLILSLLDLKVIIKRVGLQVLM